MFWAALISFHIVSIAVETISFHLSTHNFTLPRCLARTYSTFIDLDMHTWAMSEFSTHTNNTPSDPSQISRYEVIPELHHLPSRNFDALHNRSGFDGNRQEGRQLPRAGHPPDVPSPLFSGSQELSWSGKTGTQLPRFSFCLLMTQRVECFGGGFFGEKIVGSGGVYSNRCQAGSAIDVGCSFPRCLPA
ncbi:uncharacterized protein K489DRAFT_252218 [Dissoconium aciculare CBS 342.82]|jgi:hypothetical protein|uniref:Secreted protein n=1 Tax=Dissoconium aciculare CBS 342.82 TaxID=1314786 RepID=A0A6J3M163_9PEZI|nr:uncharacterized protein K489DRAFT_252218 [Dissoconium aciculare CBS 342.82]KAF1821618.1 hypothetical protein K489DRAFT_252218 [Dissoconium aciculare CBS 342.82]